MLKYLSVLAIILLFCCQSPKNPENKNLPEATPSGYWYQQPLRILQTVLRQPDAANYDVDSLVQYMKKAHSNTLVINGGGIVDYFQNTLPMANINPYIGERDLLADIVKGCHDNDIKVIARVDFRGVHKERYDLHPDWFAQDENGEPIILNYTTPGLYAPCYNGYYRNEHAVEFISQLFETYHVDGIWHNSVNFHSACYCDRCQALYQEANHKPVPVKSSPEADWETYYQWNEKIASKHLAKMQATVKNYGEDKSYAAEVFDMFSVERQKHTGINLYNAAEYFDFFVTVSFIADNSSEVIYKDLFYPSAIIKFLKSLAPKKSPVILFGGNGAEHRYIYDPQVDSKIWLWEAAASAGGFWNCYFNGTSPANTFDNRNAYLAVDAYKYIEDNANFIKHLQPVTDVALFYSKSTGHLLGNEDFEHAMRGALRFLEEAHYQYGFVSDHNLTIEKLQKFKVLIMPNVASLSDAHAEIIDKWVNQGGKLIATSQTSLYDEWSKTRQNFALSDVFGVSYNGKIVDTKSDSYQKIITRNNLMAGFENTVLLHNGGKTLMTDANADATVVTGYLPKINNQPPENAFPDNWDSNNPIIVMNNYGKGQVVYFANEVAKLNYFIGHPDYHDLLKNAVNTLLGHAEVLKTNAPSSVHVYLNQNTEALQTYQLSLVNTSSGSQRPLRDLVPVSNITIELPFQITSYESLIKNTDIKISLKGNVITIDNLNEFCSLKLNL